jgi:hypothetical protein
MSKGARGEVSLLAVLKGKQVKEATAADGYLAILFEDGDSGLNVYNNCTVREGSLSDMTGAIVVDVGRTGDYLKIAFNTGLYLLVGKRECDYHGPESLVYFAGGNFYVEQ